MKRSRTGLKLFIMFGRLGALEKKLVRLPLVHRIVGPRLWNESNLDATYVPVDVDIEVPPGTVLPHRIIEELITSASHRFILDHCYCRTVFNCRSYPRGFACIFLGEGAREINREFGREASVEEALDHLDRGSETGLLPCIVHSSWDAYMFGIDSYDRMLAICFCCNCCCAFRTDMKKGPQEYRDRILRLPGLFMRSAGDCAGCGKCAAACFLGAVTLTPEGPVFSDDCKGCGFCARACPRENIVVEFDPGVDTRESLFSRIRARTDITGSGLES